MKVISHRDFEEMVTERMERPTLQIQRPREEHTIVDAVSGEPTVVERVDPDQPGPARKAISMALSQTREAKQAAARAREQSQLLRVVKNLLREQERRAVVAAVKASAGVAGASVAEREASQALALRKSAQRAREAAIKVRAAAYKAARRAARTVERARQECEKLGLSQQIFDNAFDLSLGTSLGATSSSIRI